MKLRGLNKLAQYQSLCPRYITFTKMVVFKVVNILYNITGLISCITTQDTILGHIHSD